MKRPGSRLLSLLRELFLLPLHAYRKLISPALPPRCKYYPSCSTYALEAVRGYGIFRGSVLAAWRLMRCNPLSNGGFDYVEDQKVFKHANCAHDHKVVSRHDSGAVVR